jgi:BASS family bile acid:Na+ symporter
LQTNQRVTIPVGRTSLQLLLTVVLPVLAGYLVSQRMPRWESRINRLGTLVANATIVWIIATVVGSTRDKLSVLDLTLLAALVLVNVLGYLAGYLGGAMAGLSEPMRRALTIEVGMQNAGLGAVLAKQLFGEQSAATIAPAMYTFGCMLTGTLLARAWAIMTAVAEQRSGKGIATDSDTAIETEHG